MRRFLWLALCLGGFYLYYAVQHGKLAPVLLQTNSVLHNNNVLQHNQAQQGQAGNSSAAAPAATAPPHPAIPQQAWLAYEDARTAVYLRDYARAERDFLLAVQLQPDFTEAWYNLGATQANMAIELVNYSERAAVDKYHDAVNSKKTARSLMMDDKWFVYTGDERTEVRYDVEQALEYSDEIASHEAELVEALHLWASH